MPRRLVGAAQRVHELLVRVSAPVPAPARQSALLVETGRFECASPGSEVAIDRPGGGEYPWPPFRARLLVDQPSFLVIHRRRQRTARARGDQPNVVEDLLVLDRVVSRAKEQV